MLSWKRSAVGAHLDGRGLLSASRLAEHFHEESQPVGRVPLEHLGHGLLEPVSTMPTWMQPITEHQPVTAMANAVRSLTLGSPELAGLNGATSTYVITSLLWRVGLVAVFAPIAVARLRPG